MSYEIYSYPLFLACVLFLTNAQAQNYYISTYAGDGIGNYSGDGGVATKANIYNPVALAIDDSGNLFIADYNNNVVRKVNASTNIITTWAGSYSGGEGYSGDGGLATAAQFYDPDAVTVDSKGNLYVADEYNNVIRKVTRGDTIYTVAGGGTSLGDGEAATDGQLGVPDGVAVDDSGNIYISDYSHERIRKVTVATGIITTIAGNGNAGYMGNGGPATSAEIFGPEGIAVDKAGKVYFADWDNEVVRRISHDSIFLFAGNDTAGFRGDGGPATDAELHAPLGVGVDDTGNVYICDAYHNCVRKVSIKTGIINTIAGGIYNGSNGYYGDGGIATAAELNDPEGVVFNNTTGDIFIADFDNNRIRELSTNTSGIAQVESIANNVQLYPNPNNGNFMVQLKDLGSNNQIQLINILGQPIYEGELNSNVNSINLNSPVAGIYFYRISNPVNELITSGKLVIE